MNFWLNLIKIILLSGGFTFVVVVILFLNPRKFERWMFIFYRVLSGIFKSFTYVKRQLDRHLVAASIQDTVNGIAERINKEAPGILPHAMKIEWVHSETPESFIRHGKGIVRLKSYDNQDRNIVASTLLYLTVGFLPRAKQYIDKSLRKACECNIAKRIFLARKETGSFDYFMEHEVEPLKKSVKGLDKDLQITEDLEGVGFFTRVFLNEIKRISQAVLETGATPQIQQEVRSFAEFLQTIANKDPNERVPLSFNGTRLKVVVILVADEEVIGKFGIAPYVNRVGISVEDGYDSIYICGWGEEFVNRVLGIKKEIVRRNLVTVIKRYEYPIPRYTGTINTGIVFVTQSNVSYFTKRKQILEVVEKLLLENVPEIKEGEIEIVSIARLPDVGSKVAARFTSAKENHDDVVEICGGRYGERYELMKAHLPGEFIRVIPWNENQKIFIINALYPLRPVQVQSVELNEEDLIAHVRVNSAFAVNKALGRTKANVKLANELTGWYITISETDGAVQGPSPEEVLKEVIFRHVPCIRNGEIEIVSLSRIPGVGSKILVKWKDDREHKEYLASPECVGKDGEFSDLIRYELGGEWVNFRDWEEDETSIIKNSLYPVRLADIDSIELRHDEMRAFVTLKNGAALRQAFGRGQSNLTLAENVSGWEIELRLKDEIHD